MGWCLIGVLLLGASPIPVAEEPAARTPPPGEKVGDWQALFRGVEYAAAESSSPRPLRIHVVRIDLREPGIEFLVTPPNGDCPGETDGLKTSTFLVKHGLQLAVNASPYAPVSQEEGAPKDVLGLSVSRGERYSKAEEGYGALLITRDNRARIARWDADLADAHSAVGGFRPRSTLARPAASPRTAATSSCWRSTGGRRATARARRPRRRRSGSGASAPTRA
jgi:hypothetical protein